MYQVLVDYHRDELMMIPALWCPFYSLDENHKRETYLKSVPSGKRASQRGSWGSLKVESIWRMVDSSASHFLSTGTNSSMWNAQPKIGSLIKLLLSIYFMFPRHSFRNARSHRYIQSTSVLWFAISKIRSLEGTISPENTTLVLLIFSKRNGHKVSQAPKKKEVAFLL